MNSRKQIVLLGIGHTNCHIIKEWKLNPIPGCDLHCVSLFEEATYSGMMPGALAAQFQHDQWRINLPKLCGNANANFILASAQSIDLESSSLSFDDRAPLRFDVLSIGIGSRPSGIEELGSPRAIVPIKPMQTFIERLDSRICEAAQGKKAQPLDIAIIGGGVASVEIAFCLQSRLASTSPTPFRLKLITSGKDVASELSIATRKKILRLLQQRGIEVHTSSHIAQVGRRQVITDQNESHSSDIVIWCTGASPHKLLTGLGLESDSKGFIATQDTLQSITDPRVFAVGDSGTIIANPSPKAGVYAVRQSPILAHNIRASIVGGSMRSFKPQTSFLKLLNTGDGKALLDYAPVSAHGRWCLQLKNWIDQRFVSKFQS